MKILFAATLLLFFLEGSNQIISAQTEDVKTLRGLRGVAVMIDLPSDAKKISLTKSQLRTDVEVELRKAGIPVLTVDKIFTEPGMSHLYVYVNPVALTGILKGAYTFHVSVNLVQMTDLRRNQSIEAYAPTWNRNKTGSGGGNKTKKGIREIVRDFVN